MAPFAIAARMQSVLNMEHFNLPQAMVGFIAQNASSINPICHMGLNGGHVP